MQQVIQQQQIPHDIHIGLPVNMQQQMHYDQQ